MITLAGWLGMFVAVANTGHLFSPIVLFSMRSDLRARALAEWERHILLPAGMIMAAFLLPLAWAISVYAAWNLYHYAMQHNGFWALTRWRAQTRDQRLTVRTAWLAATAVGMQFPALSWPVSLFHWFGDIGLSILASRQRLVFLVSVSALAATGLVLMDHNLREAYPALVRARLALGFVHFIVSALIWPGALNRGDGAWAKQSRSTRPSRTRFAT